MMDIGCKHNECLREPTLRILSDTRINMYQPLHIEQESTYTQARIRDLLTEIRLRKMMWGSGTPFCMSSSIAWQAEFPLNKPKLV